MRTLARCIGVLLLATGCAPPKAPVVVPPALPTGLTDRDVRAALTLARDAVVAAPEDGAAWFELGAALHAQGFTDSAQLAYERAVELEPGHAKAWHHLALARESVGDLPGARGAMAQALRLAPGEAQCAWRLGEWLLDDGRLDEAEARFEAARRADPSGPAPVVGLARVQLQRGEALRALELLEPLARSRPDDIVIRNLAHRAARQSGRREDWVRPPLRPPSASSARPPWPDPWQVELTERSVGFGRRLQRAFSLLDAGRGSEAEPELRALLDERPGDPRLIDRLALSLLLQDRAEEAAPLLLELVAREPERASSRLYLATALQFLGRLEAALEQADRGLELRPDLATGHERRGVLLELLGRRVEAAEAYRTGVRLDPGDAILRLRLGDCLLHLGDAEGAARSFESAVRLSPSDPRGHHGLGEALLEAHRPESARLALDRAVALGADPAEIRALLAESGAEE